MSAHRQLPAPGPAAPGPDAPGQLPAPGPAAAAAALLAPLTALAEQLRDEVLAACGERSIEQLAEPDDTGPGDTAFAIDRVSEDRLRVLTDALAAKTGTDLLLVAEGVGAHATGRRPAYTLLADPLDGTRPLAFQKRSAWVLLGLAPGTSATLDQLILSVAVEVPTLKAGFADVLTAVRGERTQGVRVDLRTRQRRPLPVRPTSTAGLEHGYGGVARYFPGARAELAAIDDEVHRRLLGPARPGKAQSFEDQYCTGGTLVELAVGHDRWAADLRPLLGERAGICAHPYDLAGHLVATCAGVQVTRPDGGPLDAPLDLTSDVAWVGYANPALRDKIEPVLQQVLTERGLL